MKILEFRDTDKKIQTIPLFKSFFHNVSYPIDKNISLAHLYTNNSEIIAIEGTDFRLVDIEGGFNDEN